MMKGGLKWHEHGGQQPTAESGSAAKGKECLLYGGFLCCWCRCTSPAQSCDLFQCLFVQISCSRQYPQAGFRRPIGRCSASEGILPNIVARIWSVYACSSAASIPMQPRLKTVATSVVFLTLSMMKSVWMDVVIDQEGGVECGNCT